MSWPNSTPAFQHEYALLKREFEAMRPELSLSVADPVLKMEGYVVVWNTKIAHGGPLQGAGKGGTRCEAQLDLTQVQRLASTMALKNAAAGLPLGGAKSGVKMDKNDTHYERKWRRFVELTAPVLHERGGCFGGYGYDKGCHIPNNALWAIDELSSKKLGSARSFTGKPVELGGTDYDNEGIAGLGVAVAACTLLETQDESVQGKRFAVQGMGAMGAGISHYFSEFGAQLRALSDPLLGGSWVMRDVASLELVEALSRRDIDVAKQLLAREAALVSTDAAEVLYQDVDVLFPAATEDVITTDNATRIQARYICEGANNPTTDAAHQILFANGKLVVPDVIANAGGIIAAFVEMTMPDSVEVIATCAKVERAKTLTREKIAHNTRELLELVMRLRVQPDHVADWMAYRNIKHGLA